MIAALRSLLRTPFVGFADARDDAWEPFLEEPP